MLSLERNFSTTTVSSVMNSLPIDDDDDEVEINSNNNRTIVALGDEKDECDNIQNKCISLNGLEDEFGNLQIFKDKNIINIPPVMGHPSDNNSPESPPSSVNPSYYYSNKGWMNGIFGCLKVGFFFKNNVDNKGVQDDWEIPFEKITDIKFISSGGQGAVFSGFLNNTLVAIKKVADLRDTDIVNLRKLNHPNIVKFKGICTQEPCFCIIMEFCPYGSLFDLLKNQKNVVTINRVVIWAKQIASGMNYLHMHKIIHRDLKSPNVLIGEEEIIKISDFGTSRTWNGFISEKMTFAGTVAWMAPEAIQEVACNEKVDIWSFGIVLWELLTCEVPYDGMEQSAIMYSVGSGKLRPPIPSTCPEGFKLIMEICWKRKPKERPCFKLICNHLEIAAAELLANYKDEQFFRTQESWKVEIKSHITQFNDKFKKRNMEYHLKDEQLIERREMEIKHILDIKKLYDGKMKQADNLCDELNQLKIRMNQEYSEMMNYFQRERKNDRGRKRFLNWKKRSKTINNNQQYTIPTKPQIPPEEILSENNLASFIAIETVPDADDNVMVPSVPPNNLLIARKGPPPQQQQQQQQQQHYGTNSSSPRSSGFGSRASSCRTSSVVIDAEIKTGYMDISETDLSSPTIDLNNHPQRVILQQFLNQDDDDDDDGRHHNGNFSTVQLHYMVPHFSPSSPIIFDRIEDDTNRNNMDTPEVSGEENLQALSRKISAISENNGNINNLGGKIRRNNLVQQNYSNKDAAYDEDSFTDEEDEIYDHSLHRRSLARRPIPSGRRLKRFYHQRYDDQSREPPSDEGNTSEYSVSTSSKSSTLDSNCGTRNSPIIPRIHTISSSSTSNVKNSPINHSRSGPNHKRHNNSDSSDSSSDSDENTMTSIASQIAA